KSFPDKIYIEFENGITAIVGPNGSGKSNIADAVRWVLGEMSTKTLRGSKMEDVIFDGTNTRRSMGYAQVSLVIDNEDSTLPLEFNDVTITRRYYRSGESEYYINKAPCRLRDINELFMDTGLGRDGYSIIGQGKIAEILSVKSEDRRQIFEEAAGISKYRYKKAEAERKLASTEDNLLRITDIVAELELRIEPLRVQSKKAKEYLTLAAEKKQFEIDVWLYNIEKSKSMLQKITVDENSAKEELLKATASLVSIETEIDACFEASKNFTVSIDTMRAEIAKINEDISNSSSEIAVLTNDIKHNDETVLMIENQLLSQQDLFLDIDNKINAQNKILEELDNKSIELNNKLSIIITKKAQIEATETAHLEKINELNNQILTITNKSTDIKIKSSSITSSKDATNAQLKVIDEDKNTIFTQHKNAIDSKDHCKEEIAQNTAKLHELDNIINGYTLKLTAKRTTKADLEASLNTLSNKIFETTNRKEMLTDMEKQYLGFGDSVKYIMKKSTQNELSGIIGTVSSQITVSNEYTLAIETALGNAISNIIVTDEQSAKSAISHLKNQRIGRATFLPINSIKGTTLDTREFINANGYISLGNELVSCNEKIDKIVKSLLGRTIIVDHLDNATLLAKKTSYKFKIVTLDGQVINAGGSMTGGSSVRNAGILTRANEIKKLSATLKEQAKSLEEIKAKLYPLENDIAKISAKLDATNSEKRVLDETAIKLSSTFSHFDVLIENLKYTLENTTKQKENLLAQLKILDETKLEFDNELTKAKEEIDTLNKDLSDISNNSDTIATNKNEINTEISTIQLQIMGISKDIEASQNVLLGFIEQKNLQSQTTTEKKEEINSINAKTMAIKLKLSSNSDFTDTATKTINEKKALIETTSNNRDENEKHITELRAKEKSENEHKERLVLENERLSSKLASLSAQYDNNIANLFDEYELTLSEAMQLKSEEINITSATKRISEIKNAIKRLGNINVDSIEEYKEVSERYTFLSSQLKDLNTAKEELSKIILNLTSSMQEIFADQFKIININFAQTFTELFGGGKAELILSDPTDILSSGIEIKVAPPGKIIKNLSALSGGEQAFVAIALYFAILKVRPTPFCILDEIEAALDDVNVVRFAEYLRKLTHKTQFISITHRRGTMEEADRLYGVTMQEKGISKMLTINVNDTIKAAL
ncbi:MAG: chromosome segregation protein SMC, partial [Clostridia bacterium]